MATKSHVVLAGSRRPKDANASRIGDVDPKQIIDVTITLASADLPSADEYVGQRLTPAEFTQKFGAKKEDAEKVAKSLKKFGLKVEKISLSTCSMHVSGTAAAMEAAFKTKLSMMRSSVQNDYRGRSGNLSIPADLRGIILGVFGLDERRMTRDRAKKGAAGGTVGNPLTPSDLEQRYNFPAGNAAGQNIIIAEFGGGFFDTDVTAYCNKFQVNVPTVTASRVDADALTLQQILALPAEDRKEELGASTEVMMDVQIVAGLCPNANINVLFSKFDQQGWVDLLNEVITENPSVVSVSWGQAEDDPGWSDGAVTAINNRLNAIRLLGITVCVASGDDGSGDELDDSKGHVDFPGSSPHVLSVGGTMLKNVGGISKEVVWNVPPGKRNGKGSGATGGGVSVEFARPSWQNVSIPSVNSKSIDGRVVPDVAALAGDPGYDLIFLGQPAPNGGTSASAPLWAALIARINSLLPAAKQNRFLTPLLYQDSGNGKTVGEVGTRDITSGNNVSNPSPGVGYPAKSGFDAASGWGVPDGIAMLTALQNV